MNKSAISISSDYNYIKHLKRALDSLTAHGTSADVYVRAVNFTDEQTHDLDGYNIRIIRDNNHVLSAKRNLMKNTGIELEHIYDISIINNGSKNIRRLLYSEQGVYTCHSRFKNINFLLAKGYASILCLDADTIFNKNIDHIFEMTGKDLYTLMTNTPESFLFFSEVSDVIFSEDKWRDWDADHVALNEVYKAWPISVGCLGDKYKDTTSDPKAYMWSGVGVNKYKTEFQNG